MTNRTFVVTGGNTGIGRAIAQALAAAEHHVVITSRNQDRGVQAVAGIQQAIRHANVEMVIGDLSTIASTHQLADTLLERFPNIAVLINNAGVWMLKKQINPDQLEYSFMVNHLAPFILSTRLLPCLKANAPARIVNVNAGLYTMGKLNLDKTPYGRDFKAIKTYANTKLCNLLFTRELARRIAGSGVTVNAVHPGVIRTHLGDASGIVGLLLRFMKRSWDTPEEGAKAPVWLATSPEVEGLNGQYFDLQTRTEVNETVKDEALCRQLWDLSTTLGLAMN
ncbi:MAG: SDR family NAD(P)-dependent oxidoreductase [Anaerolineales bacterium]|nr:SDR family NAD(P)-dependent oxidoreductase [Anaerolineales bacterium]MCB8954239.1 SDR family NAD(P)-dependent oxidoreductase [Ardenticatenales bacterium]